MYQKGEALLIHGASIPYTGRSHFEGQNLIEVRRHDAVRLDHGLDGACARCSRIQLRGDVAAPAADPARQVEARQLLSDLDGSGPAAGLRAYPAALGRRRFARRLWQAGNHRNGRRHAFYPFQSESERPATLADLARNAGQRLSRPNGPRWRCSTMSVSTPMPTRSRTTRSASPRSTMPSRRSELPPQIDVWKNTLIVTVTEFGRTAFENGSRGTDHGYGTAILVMGGKLSDVAPNDFSDTSPRSPREWSTTRRPTSSRNRGIRGWRGSGRHGR